MNPSHEATVQQKELNVNQLAEYLNNPTLIPRSKDRDWNEIDRVCNGGDGADGFVIFGIKTWAVMSAIGFFGVVGYAIYHAF